jgi:hypothetical protein
MSDTGEDVGDVVGDVVSTVTGDFVGGVIGDAIGAAVSAIDSVIGAVGKAFKTPADLKRENRNNWMRDARKWLAKPVPKSASERRKMIKKLNTFLNWHVEKYNGLTSKSAATKRKYGASIASGKGNEDKFARRFAVIIKGLRVKRKQVEEYGKPAPIVAPVLAAAPTGATGMGALAAAPIASALPSASGATAPAVATKPVQAGFAGNAISMAVAGLFVAGLVFGSKK